MSCATIIDTETTGVDEPDVVQLAHIGPLEFSRLTPEPPEPAYSVGSTFFKPRKPIGLGALATHHILEEELTECAPWPGSWLPPPLTDYLVGHNVDFDWKAIGSPPVKRICTLALSRRLWPDADSHSLGAMTYLHAEDRRQARAVLRDAHGADVDAMLCKLLLGNILRAMPLIASWDRLWEASERARLPTHLTFGKYGPHSEWAKSTANKKGLPIPALRGFDPGYRDWLLSGKCDTVNDDPYLRKALEAA